jgi:hypothetical protein
MPKDFLLLSSRWLAWTGVWVLHVCVLMQFPIWELPSSCAAGARLTALHCGWVCAAARLSRRGLPCGLVGMAALAVASPALRACFGSGHWAAASRVAQRAYPAGCAMAGCAALLAGLRAARSKEPEQPGEAPSSAASWHPLGTPATDL